MKAEINIAIFGLSLNVLESIKQKVRSLYDDALKISWSNIADPQLDILLVNDMFFGSPTIQNLVGSQQIPYLRLINKNEKSGHIEGDKLYLPFMATDEIRQWFRDRHLHVPVVQPADKKADQTVQTQDLKKIVQELFYERNGNLQIFDSSGNIGLVNTRTEQVWVDSDRKVQGLDSSLNYTYATLQTAEKASAVQGQDLRSWLWNVLWHSPELPQINHTQAFYQLQYWPQPDSAHNRQHVFKIAACFEQGASLSQVQKKLDLPLQEIRHFVNVALMMDMLKKIDARQARLSSTGAKQSESAVRSFLGKLRRRLGL
ncbi:hypothetical protein [Acinetobacter sp. WZC-1]|uniref:hypothetical protein n=1 Tax=Acinetobacter sp. WZC-1 TaxID=3459034 RepID=UPI00403E17DF